MKKVLLLFAVILGSSALISCEKSNDEEVVSSEAVVSSEKTKGLLGRIRPLTGTSGTWTCTNQEGASRSYTIFKPGRSEGLACELIDKTGKLVLQEKTKSNHCERKLPGLLATLQEKGFSCQ